MMERGIKKEEYNKLHRRWVPLTTGLYVVTEQKEEFFSHFIVWW